MADPMHQFEVQKIVDLPDFSLPGVGVIDMSITNSTVAMFLAAGLIVAFFALATAKAAVVPGRLQLLGEGIFSYIDNLTTSIIGHEGRKFFPFIFTLFLFILAMNLLGMFLVFTATSQLAVTATLAAITILLVLIVGIARNGANMYKLFVPAGVPWYMLVLVTPIELISFLLRPVTLALRLFGNMLGGHVALKVFAGFVVSLGALAAGGGLGLLGIPGALLSLGGVVALTALEFLVAFLQAFVFAVLACVYLNDVVNLGHHH
ncbi:MAG: F0F1 ATP synthase subunit A [Phenylobacterium sp.]|jgi:F-type H+-transporting ATPase subunit a|uniref:F0F1 ATP synthase subunit A n=1 Tax=Phenylobacterium sp. TaxID=1871053 RepID=UPI002A2B2D6C|nr:F0F1 ATP synthase subunit A [Phenylobacterium sp.]MDD3838908.1 F0F1 ATP synthase subunit A [Phenylobacterium sp.]MDX9997741.1 F0F1 ATP synthase subunit A [Phenylobacterium sp.]